VISISEVVVVLVVAVLFIKPENLPDAAYTVGKWIKWLRQTTHHVRQELEKPLENLTENPATLVQPLPSVPDEKPHG
jgi:Sec-independent protein translocase protein TatA